MGTVDDPGRTLASAPPMKHVGLQVAKNSAWNVAGLVVTACVSLITVPLIVRVLGSAGYGVVSVVNAIIGSLALLSLNIGTATTKLVAECRDGDAEDAAAIVRTSLGFVSLVSVAGASAVYFAAPLLVTGLFSFPVEQQETALQAVRWTAAGWPLIQLMVVMAGVVAGHQRFDLVGLATGSYAILVGVLSIGSLLIAGDLRSFVQAKVLSQALGVLVWGGLVARLMGPKVLVPGFHPSAFARAMRFGSWQTLGQAGSLAMTQGDKYALGIAVSADAVGRYDLAMTLQQQVYMLGMKCSEVLLPAFSKRSRTGDGAGDASRLVEASWLLNALSAALLVPLAVMGADLVGLWVGPQMVRGSGEVLRILAFAGLLGSSSNAVFFYLLGAGRTGWTAAIAIATGATVIVGTVLLVPRFGIQGAGWGNVAAMLVQGIVVVLACRVLLRGAILLRELMAGVHLPVVVGAGVALLLIAVRTLVGGPSGWAGFIVAYGACSALTVAAITAANLFVRGGRERNRAALGMVRAFAEHIFSLLTTSTRLTGR